MNVNVSPEVCALIVFVNGFLCSAFAHLLNKKPVRWFFIGALTGLIGLLALLIPLLYKSLKAKKEPVLVAAAPVPLQVEPIQTTQWHFINSEKKTIGPLSIHELQEKWREGAIDPSTFVWNTEMTDWKKIDELSTLKNDLTD